MKKIASIFALLFSAILFSQLTVFSQGDQSAKWIRVQSDDGEFSIEVPAKHTYFYDKDGFEVTKKSKNYRLQKMSMLNAYSENTLVSFESYETKKNGLDAVYEYDKAFAKNAKVSDFNHYGAAIKQILVKTDEYYCVRQYFYSKARTYILTAASRNGETAVAKRFLDSLIFKTDTIEKPNPDAVLFSSLKGIQVDVNIAIKNDKNKTRKDNTSKTPIEQDKNVSKLILVNKPAPSYVDVARMNAVQGAIQFEVIFGENSFIPKIEVEKSLPDGLLRQAVFALLRVKFLPKEEAGKAVSTTRTIEYNFLLY